MPDSHTFPPKLAAAVVGAQRAVRAVGKDGTNKFHGYKYATAETMLEEGRVSLNSAGLTLSLLSSRIVVAELPVITTRKGGDSVGGPCALVEVDLVLVHESGESVTYTRTWPVVPEAGRPVDKAVGGALTTALSYAIRDLLLIPRDDDKAAMDRRDDDPEAPAPVPQRAEAAPRAAASTVEPIARVAGAPEPSVFDQMVAALRAGERLVLEDIEQAGVEGDAAGVLYYAIQAFALDDADKIAELAAEVKAPTTALSPPFRAVAMDLVGEAWDRASTKAA